MENFKENTKLNYLTTLKNDLAMQRITQAYFDQMMTPEAIQKEIDLRLAEAPLRVMVHNKSNRVGRIVMNIRNKGEDKK